MIWRRGPASPVGGPRVVHLWRATLDVSDSLAAVLSESLTEAELRRADRFLLERERRRYICGRGLLRDILGRYLGRTPALVPLAAGPAGKPALAVRGELLRFNMAHSGGLALYGLAWGREIGVDVEQVRPERLLAPIARRFFAPAEQAALFSLPASRQAQAFYACWTRKEAYVKARGTGIALGLQRFVVALRPGEPAALLHAQEGPVEVARWALRHVMPAPGYLGAVAVEGHGWRMQCWQWHPTEGGVTDGAGDVNQDCRPGRQSHREVQQHLPD